MVVVVLVLAAIGGGAFVLLSGDDDDESSEESDDNTTDDSGSDDGERQAYVDALVATADQGVAQDFPGLDIECAAGEVVDAIGVDNMALSPDEIEADEDYEFADLADGGLSEEQGGAIYDGFADCGVDWRQLFDDQLATEGLTDSQLACVDDAVDDEMIRDLFVGELIMDAELAADAEAQLEDAGRSCQDA